MLPQLLLGAAVIGGAVLLLKKPKIPQDVLDAVRGTDAQGRKVAPTSGTAAFDQPVFVSKVGPPPPPTASQVDQVAFTVAVQEAAKQAPASTDQVATAAAAAGVTVADFQAAAIAIGSTADQIVAMGATPRDINDIVAQNRPGFGRPTAP